MYDRILVSLDGSQLAEESLPYAEELSGRLGAELTLLYVSESSKDTGQHMHHFYIQNKAEAVKDLAQLFTDKSDSRQVIEVKSAISIGNPAEKIVEYADKENMDIIIMSTHGRSGITRWALGSVADKVVRANRKPVLLIRARGVRPEVHTQKLLQKILAPLDGSHEGEAVIPHVAELAAKLQAKVTLLQALPQGYLSIATGDYIAYTPKQIEADKTQVQQYLDKVQGWLKQKGIAAESKVIVKTGGAAEEIINFAAEIKADMVIMSTHGRSGVGRWVIGSVAEKVLHEGNTPLMLIRSPKA
jgi:nucleotide-binding universal stress UspA family protein